METENTPTHSSEAKTNRGQTPWGVVIAILLILGIVVSGAYYAFTQRIAPTTTSSSTP